MAYKVYIDAKVNGRWLVMEKLPNGLNSVYLTRKEADKQAKQCLGEWKRLKKRGKYKGWRSRVVKV